MRGRAQHGPRALRDLQRPSVPGEAASDGATHDIGLLSAGGYANAGDQDAFCDGSTCTVSKIYDQTGRGNNLTPGPAGTSGMGADRGADAGEIAVTAGGHKVYGIWISPGVGYRYTGAASGVATNGQPEGVYMVASGTHVGSGCCFDYGNAERTPSDTGNGHMDAVSIATTCYFAPCTGSGPWVEADMENGMFQGANGCNTANQGNSSTYVTAMLKNNGQNTYAIKGGNSQSGGSEHLVVRGRTQPRGLQADAAGGRHHPGHRR